GVRSGERRERRGMGGVEDERAGIGACLGNDGAGFAPDQFGPAGTEAPVSAERQLSRRSVGLAVASLHRLDRQAIPDAPGADCDRREEGGELVPEMKIQAQLPRVREQGFARFILEVSRHAGALRSGSCGCRSGTAGPASPLSWSSSAYRGTNGGLWQDASQARAPVILGARTRSCGRLTGHSSES